MKFTLRLQNNDTKWFTVMTNAQCSSNVDFYKLCAACSQYEVDWLFILHHIYAYMVNAILRLCFIEGDEIVAYGMPNQLLKYFGARIICLYGRIICSLNYHYRCLSYIDKSLQAPTNLPNHSFQKKTENIH